MFFMILGTYRNQAFIGFSPAQRIQLMIFSCHTVTHGTDLRRSPLKPPPETKKIPNDQPTQLFGSILVELPPKVSKSGNERVLQKLHFCPFFG